MLIQINLNKVRTSLHHCDQLLQYIRWVDESLKITETYGTWTFSIVGAQML